jgi:hypothetical protein
VDRFGRLCRQKISFPVILSCAVVLGFLTVCPIAPGQQQTSPALEGYVTAVHSPTGFDVNGTIVTTAPSTEYRTLNSKGIKNGAKAEDVLRVGAYVEVMGTSAEQGVGATSVTLLEDQDKKIEGFGVIDKVIAAGPEPLYQADGYRIRIVSGTQVTYGGDLKTLVDVGTNTWVKYEGKRDLSGVLVATRAQFVRARQGKVKPSLPESLPTQPSLIDANGRLVSAHTKVRLSDAGGYCGWHKVTMDQALQERVRRVGMRVIPEYQKQLPDDSPSKIHFRIYVVEEPSFREDLECVEGLILVPRQVVERLVNEDQLAAVMANGVAYSIEAQSARLRTEGLELVGAELAGDVASSFVPAVNVGVLVGGMVVNHEIERRMREQAGRIALALMADAGYDPWQAPETWRLLAPKKLPGDVKALPYPDRAGYQLGILNLQYKDTRASAAGPAQ